MHAKQLLHKIFTDAYKQIDSRIHRSLLLASTTLAHCKHLSIAGIGRALSSSAATKHNIKRIDRLFGNSQLHNRQDYYYQSLINILVGTNKRPKILVDWSGLTRCGEYHFLRASVPVGGRSLTLLDKTYRLDEYMTQRSHKHFLQRLKSMLPKDCKPIIVTDAGFRCPWFKLVLSLNWDFIGRVRNQTLYQQESDTPWLPIKLLYQRATASAKYLFDGLLAKANPVKCHFYMLKQSKKYRVKKNLVGKKIQCSVSKKHAKRESEPWLIASSLSNANYSAKHVINIYKLRMQIEESFRDLKNTKNGFSLRHCRSYSKPRLDVTLLIANIAMLLLWTLGLIAKQKKIHFNFQANTIRHRNVLSNFVIGWQLLKRKGFYFAAKEFSAAVSLLQQSGMHV